MYRGEALNFYLYGDSTYSLENVDFCVYIYADDNISTNNKKKKNECVKQDDGSYLCTFGSSVTKNLPLCTHTIEVHDLTNSVIYVHKRAFNVEPSATAMESSSTTSTTTSNESQAA